MAGLKLKRRKKNILDTGLGQPRKKSSFLSDRATKRRRGLNGCATKKTRFFFNGRKKVPLATKPRGGEAKALVTGQLRKITFFLRLPLLNYLANKQMSHKMCVLRPELSFETQGFITKFGHLVQSMDIYLRNKYLNFLQGK